VVKEEEKEQPSHGGTVLPLLCGWEMPIYRQLTIRIYQFPIFIGQQ